MVPLLRAHGSDLYRRQYASMVREREIMKDVPGWRAGENVYHGHRYSIHLHPPVNRRYVQPEYLLAPPEAEEKPIVVKEPRNWFWQRKKKEDKKQEQ